MRSFKKIALAAVAAFGAAAFTLTACGGTGNSKLLAAAAESTPLEYNLQRDENLLAVRRGAEGFAARFAPEAYKTADKSKNFAVSPVSVYTALALAADCSQSVTREELEGALGVNCETLGKGFPYLYRSLNVENRNYDGKLISRVTLGNSIWLDHSAVVKEAGLVSLSQKFFCNSYHADFMRENKEANNAVRKFIKEQTHGLIDRDIQLSTDTLLALINTLYLKEVWNHEGDELALTSKDYDFTAADGNVKRGRLMTGYYQNGRATEEERYKSFFTATNSGYKIKFIVPADGYSVEEVFDEATLSEANAKEYLSVDEENKIIYRTRCLFPAYEADFDGDVKDILKEKFGIESLFAEGACDFGNVTDDSVYCERVTHVAKLKVDRRGVEGAAVTVMGMNGTAAPGNEYETVYEDFVVDRAFAFVLTDPYGTTLFSGVVNKI